MTCTHEDPWIDSFVEWLDGLKQPGYEYFIELLDANLLRTEIMDAVAFFEAKGHRPRFCVLGAPNHTLN